LIGVVDGFDEVYVANSLDLEQDVYYHKLKSMDSLMVIAIMMKIVPILKDLADFHAVLFRIADFTVEDAHVFNHKFNVKSYVGHIHASAISLDVVDLIHIDRVTLIVDNVKKEALLVHDSRVIALSFNQTLNEDGILTFWLYRYILVFFQHSFK